MRLHAASLDLASFEDPVFYDKNWRCARASERTMVLLTSFLNLGQEAITFATLSASLIRFFPRG